MGDPDLAREAGGKVEWLGPLVGLGFHRPFILFGFLDPIGLNLQ